MMDSSAGQGLADAIYQFFIAAPLIPADVVSEEPPGPDLAGGPTNRFVAKMAILLLNYKHDKLQESLKR